jgi:hypothetical protein
MMSVLRKRIEDDFLSLLRTLTLAHLEGGLGLQHLREDLNERAKVRQGAGPRSYPGVCGYPMKADSLPLPLCSF